MKIYRHKKKIITVHFMAAMLLQTEANMI
jgi:hypothetical protein